MVSLARKILDVTLLDDTPYEIDESTTLADNLDRNPHSNSKVVMI